MGSWGLVPSLAWRRQARDAACATPVRASLDSAVTAPCRGGRTGWWPLSPHSALTKVQAVFVLVAGSGLPWPLPPCGAQPEALSGSRVLCAGNKDGSSPGLGCGSGTLHFWQCLGLWSLCPIEGSFVVICKWGERRAS